MKLLLQRVKKAEVTVDQKVVGSIGSGLLVFLGIHKSDTTDVVPWLVNKLLNLRIFSDEQGKLNYCIKDIDGEILVVSQFTLYANCTRGRRPDFIQTAPPEIAESLYETFISQVRKELGRVETGQFGASMNVSLVNDGPMTILLEKERDKMKN